MHTLSKTTRAGTTERTIPAPTTLGLLLLALALFLATVPAQARITSDFSRPGLLIGADDDNEDNPTIQIPGTAANQSLNNTDILSGGEGRDVLIGLLGSDVLDGGTGDDIMIGGPEAFVAPNKDVAMGGSGNDLFIWAPGDGSDAFLGGEGDYDAMVFGIIDRDEDGVPLITDSARRPRTGIPTANTSGLPGFCRLERASRRDTGFDYLVRFFTRADGVLRVTVRQRDVEQVFCANEAGDSITYIDLTQDVPVIQDVTLDQVRQINPLVGQIIR